MINALVDVLAVSLNQSPDNLRVLVSLLFMYPISWLFSRVKPHVSPTFLHIFSILCSIYFVGSVLQLWYGLAYLCLEVILVYFLVIHYKHQEWMPKLVMTVCMLFITVTHIRAFFWVGADEDYSYDHAGPQMLLTIKLTSFAYNIADGLAKEEDLLEYQKRFRVTDQPDFLEFLGFVFFFPTFLVGNRGRCDS